MVGWFKLSEIANMDQTPLAFDFMSTRTYDKKGAKTVWFKESRGGWYKRQATLQVCAFADGINRLKPLLIFHGVEKGDSRRREEEKRYSPDVKVLWNPKTYANEGTMLYWLKHMWRTSPGCSVYVYTREQEPCLVLDAFKAHLTPKIAGTLKSQRTTISVIPGGCTGYIQPLDVSLNKPLKDLIQEEQDDHYDCYINEWESGKVPYWGATGSLDLLGRKAWKRLHLEYKNTIINTFRNVGLTLNPDGSEDSNLKIKDLPDIAVGDYCQIVLVSISGIGLCSP
jgi:hypothetical protein